MIGDADFELMLTSLRASLLQDLELQARTPPRFLRDLALQCFNNEFVYAETPAETAAVERLCRSVESRLSAHSDLDEPLQRAIALLGAYRPLHGVKGADSLLAPAKATVLEPLVRATIADRLEEDRLRATLPALTPVRDGVSTRVRALYEENPYPRWLSLATQPPVPAAQWIAAELKGEARALTVADAPRTLVAGCGTGREAITLATEVSGAKVTAVDLSLTSLAYAKRKAREMNVGNLEFWQADLLELDTAERFDVVCCVGVLHHLRDPAEGLRALLRLARPGAVFKLGLYSAASRADLNLARELVRGGALPATPASVRALRQQILAAKADSPLRRVLRYRDFFSMSECRDLLFHVQDHEFTLPGVAALLREHGLTVIGVSNPAAAALTAYRELFPGDRQMADLERWDRVEQLYPQAFPGMYQFWCQLVAA